MPKPAPHRKKDISEKKKDPSGKKKDIPEIFLWVFRAGICFILLSALLFLLGFATNSWHRDKASNYGLWEKCVHGRCSPHEQSDLPDYHTATQALEIVAMIIYVLAPVTHFLVYCMKKKKSTDFRTRIFEVGYSVGSLVHVLGVIVFGCLHPSPDSLSWSYIMSGAAAVLAVVGTVLVIISRNKALRFFHFLPPKTQKPRRGRVDALSHSSSSSSRAETPQSATPSVNRLVFGPQARQSIDSQISVNVDVHNSLNQSDSSYVTSMSRQAFPHSYRTISPGTSNQIPFRTLSLSNPQIQSSVINPVLRDANNPSTSTSELAPLRAHLLPPLLEITPV